MSRVPAGRSVEVRVPASSANLGPGFDSIGLALGLWDHYVVTTSDTPGLLIEVTGEGAVDVPTDERHLVHATMQHTWRILGVEPPPGLRLVAANGVPHGRGLGSSATAIVAGVVAAQALSLGVAEGSYAVWPAAGEAVPVDLGLATDVSSRLEGHPDNASASVLGGLTVSWMPDGSGLDRGDRTVTAHIDLHPDVDVVVFVPETQLATRTARAVLPETVPLAAAAAGAGRAALLVHALTADPSHLHAATRDWLHQEARRPSYPATMELVDLLRSQGRAAVVSGAGPSVLVLTTREAAAAVQAGHLASHWERLSPSVPLHGATVHAR
ncbi:homoserine kinase [Terrabacter tumescens]|uniref:Homoserine kinase n=1 Tax=Terrabacter tumescens TaxID=60443 RepID=A0ABQ2HTL9_9MICO|nr:homoserine kinase [Terrabacter tumescens]GGM91245.1 homoserine kinase [Terrabacter tumescens]